MREVLCCREFDLAPKLELPVVSERFGGGLCVARSRHAPCRVCKVSVLDLHVDLAFQGGVW